MEATYLGKYQLVRHLARGGMADVFLGVETLRGGARRLVALKTVSQELADNPRMIECFLDEARLTLCCAHPNVLHGYELGYAKGKPYLALEYVSGTTVLELIRAGQRAGRLVSVPAAVAVVAGVAAALDYLHQLPGLDGTPLDVLHRDVTPANILISSAGNVRLIDLGIARSRLQSASTAAGSFAGKFAYQAPEQVLQPETVDQRADLFALGVVLHELLCGRPLFRGEDNRGILLNVLSAPIPDPREVRDDVPPELVAVLNRALARDPEQRYASAADLAADLEDVAVHMGAVLSARRLAAEVRMLCGDPAAIAIPDRAAAFGSALSALSSALDELGPSEVDEDEVDDFVIEIEEAPEDEPLLSPRMAAGSDCGLSVERPARRPDHEYEAMLAWLTGA